MSFEGYYAAEAFWNHPDVIKDRDILPYVIKIVEEIQVLPLPKVLFGSDGIHG